jgi:epoxyqueuosine reductase
MDKPYFESKIWPHMFYMSSDDLWRWRMNVARAMGNTRDPMYTDDLIRAFRENQDDRVRAMSAWALGQIGQKKDRSALDGFLTSSAGQVQGEVQDALDRCI